MTEEATIIWVPQRWWRRQPNAVPADRIELPLRANISWKTNRDNIGSGIFVLIVTLLMANHYRDAIYFWHSGLNWKKILDLMLYISLISFIIIFTQNLIKQLKIHKRLRIDPPYILISEASIFDSRDGFSIGWTDIASIDAFFDEGSISDVRLHLREGVRLPKQVPSKARWLGRGRSSAPMTDTHWIRLTGLDKDAFVLAFVIATMVEAHGGTILRGKGF